MRDTSAPSYAVNGCSSAIAPWRPINPSKDTITDASCHCLSRRCADNPQSVHSPYSSLCLCPHRTAFRKKRFAYAHRHGDDLCCGCDTCGRRRRLGRPCQRICPIRRHRIASYLRRGPCLAANCRCPDPADRSLGKQADELIRRPARPINRWKLPCSRRRNRAAVGALCGAHPWPDPDGCCSSGRECSHDSAASRLCGGCRNIARRCSSDRRSGFRCDEELAWLWRKTSSGTRRGGPCGGLRQLRLASTRDFWARLSYASTSTFEQAVLDNFNADLPDPAATMVASNTLDDGCREGKSLASGAGFQSKAGFLRWMAPSRG